MKGLDKEIIKYICENNLERDLLKGNFGIEKENVRVDKNGRLSTTPHPKVFGDRLNNLYITTDFAESQVEMVTPVVDTLEETYEFLDNLQNIVSLELEEELLWPQSNPPILPDDEKIYIANFNDTSDGKEARRYRDTLAEKYGKKIQLISGIHYNFSLKDKFLDNLYKEFGKGLTFTDFKNKVYLKIAKNLLRYRWLLIYLTGASPIVHKTYDEKIINNMKNINEESYHIEDIVSFRNGSYGYKNEKDFIISYDNVESYVRDIEELISSGELDSAREFYSPVRLKAEENKDTLNSLLKDGIKYLELRFIDLNPFNKNGIDLETLYLVHLLVLFSLFQEDEPFDEESQKVAYKNHELVASFGRNKNLELYENFNTKNLLCNMGKNIFEEIRKLISVIGEKEEFLIKVVDDAIDKLENPNKTIANKIVEKVLEKSYMDFHIELAKEYLKESKENEFKLTGYEDLELSTQVLLKASIKRGIKFEILDRKDNFIALDNGKKVEYTKQATKTSLDPYSSVMIMENKLVTKHVLDKVGIRVPIGKDYFNSSSAKKDFTLFKDKSIVIKPKFTNFGVGITIFKDTFSKESYERAIDIAFEHDDSILIEEFLKGNEYRFLVLGDKVEGVLNRVPANVVGDGKSSIEELINRKNSSPLRGEGHRTPLEIITIGEIEKMFLNQQGKDINYVPLDGETVYLRENSNISTGGDSIDCTEDILKSYKDIAIKAAKTVGASICGVDMIIEDISQDATKDNYGIIELNFNPAVYMHCYPYKGVNRNIGEKILDLLDL
ncbi:glutamate-cysteine ligase GshA [Gottschalkia purinilytica]|uniref:Glutathione biosynthesis bifunctional protein GshAB n=1 Tax=Gottschalkia purinilytica TaxID=1503 RepID=A0A0L0WAZ8_GOTPU|nr:glutamate-cysteine ligase GshA [Gottschalkia purinilytica]